MAHESLVYGCIVGHRWKSSDLRRLQRLNRAEIAALPETDEWPFIPRSMFAIPDDKSQVTYRSELIYFGATFNAIEWGSWNEWLVKFEGLLARLFWRDVYLHLKTELVGNYDYHYLPIDYWNGFESEPPRPASIWTLTGGPRGFIDADPEDLKSSTWLYTNGIWEPQPEEVEQNEGDG